MPSRPFLSSVFYFGGLVISALEYSIYRALLPTLREAIDHAFDHPGRFLNAAYSQGTSVFFLL